MILSPLRWAIGLLLLGEALAASNYYSLLGCEYLRSGRRLPRELRGGWVAREQGATLTRSE